MNPSRRVAFIPPVALVLAIGAYGGCSIGVYVMVIYKNA